MDHQTAEIRKSQWEQIIIECNRAPITKREWCRQNGISEKSFFYWQRKIRKQTVKEMKQLSSDLPVQRGSGDQAVFAVLPFTGINAIPEGNETLTMNAVPELMIQVNHCSVYVSGSVQESILKTVMKVIRDA